MKKLLLTAMISMAAATASANDYIEHKVYSDPNFEQKREQAVQILQKKGYSVGEIDADDHWGKPVLEIEAYKNGREYDVIMSYPDLKIIREVVDY